MMRDYTRISESRGCAPEGCAMRGKIPCADGSRTTRPRFVFQAWHSAPRFLAIFIAAILGVSACASAQQTAQSSGAAFAVSDGHGQISLMWFPPSGQWPLGGWKIEDSTGGTAAAHVTMGDADALKGLSPKDAATVQKLPETLASSATSGSQGKMLYGILALNAFGSPAYARALGLSWTLQGVAPGARTYRISGLSATGQPTGLVLSAAPVDAGAATPLPPTPADPRAEASRNGVALLWTPIPENRALPVISYDVLRDSSEQSGVEVNARPVITGVKWDPKTPIMVDREAPVEEMLTYHISSLDIFGRRSAPADIKILFPDFAALEPPEPVVAASTGNKVEVTWKAGTNPHTAGYVVERGYLYDGPFEALTPQALPPGTKNFEDAQVRGGTAYYYRVRAVGPRGDMGSPSHAAMAQPANGGAPPKPSNLKAELGNTRVRLSWDPVSFPVAGYFIERLGVSSAASSGALSGAKPSAPTGDAGWVHMNARVTPEPLYDDYFGMTSGATFSYRIVAVAYDNEESAPSDAVSVTLPDTSLPAI
ncbi:MAG: fibronectin type III domain-containing protein, partial [Candidatus Acidiferrales bacterium]